jgi:peptide deformylase
VTEFDADLSSLSKEMIETMRAESGIGLAGPQIGQRMRIFVMEIPPEMDADETGRRLNPFLKGPLVVINPDIEILDDEQDEMEEGCLSIPDVRGKVERPFRIRMTYQTVSGGTVTQELQGLAARCAQHEMDHLNGILFIDYLGPVKKRTIKGKLKKIKQNYAK